MKRPLGIGVLLAFYVLQSTWLLHAGVDLFIPGPGTETAALCEDSGCCCPKDLQDSGGCCCSAEQKAARAGRALAQAQCRGSDAAVRQAFTQPVTCAFATSYFRLPESSLFEVPETRPLLPEAATPPEKVPIEPA